MRQDEDAAEPVARAGHFGTIDLAAVERRLRLADETIAAATRRLELLESMDFDLALEEELGADSSARLASVNARAKIAASPAQPSQE
ncbi:hypothetical protein GCM10009765_00510 [Fodinicola feengrottensis]|uniref:Uncharacterized protein n=1 Tax=Fodinicola feengrottensis TaxID=435914 RepID=A0ABN2FNV5_9ACTN